MNDFFAVFLTLIILTDKINLFTRLFSGTKQMRKSHRHTKYWVATSKHAIRNFRRVVKIFQSHRLCAQPLFFSLALGHSDTRRWWLTICDMYKLKNNKQINNNKICCCARFFLLLNVMINYNSYRATPPLGMNAFVFIRRLL